VALGRLRALADPLRASVPEAVAHCRRAGIRVVMITGDLPGTALESRARRASTRGEALERRADRAMDDAALARGGEA
jgi:Ca2+-transporting ATPase